MKMRTSIALFALALTATTVQAEAVPEAAPCPGNADALGTARVLPVNAAATPRVGRKHFPQTLALAPKEVVLTFDDGPASGTTGHVLERSSANAYVHRSSCWGATHSPIRNLRGAR
jgi:hypothetical protein